MARRNERINYQATTPNDWTWQHVEIEILMDIRSELQKLNTLLHCTNFVGIPRTLKRISSNTAKPRKPKSSAQRKGSEVMEFQEFEKISRLNREVIVTEKIDGTNGQVLIRTVAEGAPMEMGYDTQIEVDGVPCYIRAGSRNR